MCVHIHTELFYFTHYELNIVSSSQESQGRKFQNSQSANFNMNYLHVVARCCMFEVVKILNF